MPRRARRPVSFEDFLALHHVDEEVGFIGVVLRGHLAIEALLVEMVGLCQEGNAWGMRFERRTEVLAEAGLISHLMAKDLNKINTFRNDCAHIFSLQPEFPEVSELAKSLEVMAFDYFDGMEGSDGEALSKAHGTPSHAMGALLVEVLHLLAYYLADAGGRDVFAPDDPAT